MTGPETSADTPAERLADALVHITGITAALIAVPALIGASVFMLSGTAVGAISVYGIALVAMLGFSAAYNMNRIPRLSGMLRRFDHAAIFLKIAGTYTPFTLVKMGGLVGYGLFGTVWAIALSGIIAKLAMRTKRNGFYIALYLALGWAGIFVIGPVVAALPGDALILLGAGAGFYTIGVIFHVWESLPFQNAIWHCFVLVGTGCHFAAVTLATIFDVNAAPV